jgi:hypothetical protein
MNSRLSETAWRRQTTGAMTAIPASAPGARMAWLRTVWLAHTVKRAMAAVGSASDADYRAFGWDRYELLAQLHGVLDEVGWEQRNCQVPLTITLSRPARSTHQADQL